MNRNPFDVHSTLKKLKMCKSVTVLADGWYLIFEVFSALFWKLFESLKALILLTEGLYKGYLLGMDINNGQIFKCLQKII